MEAKITGKRRRQPAFPVEWIAANHSKPPDEQP